MSSRFILPSSLRAALTFLSTARLGTVVFGAAMLVRLMVLFRSTDTTHFLPIQGDMKFYSDWALRISHGQWTDYQSFYGLPLYAYLLAGLYRVIGFQPYVALLLQVLAEGATAWFIYQLAPLAFQRAGTNPEPATPAADDGAKIVGLLAALGWMFFVPAQAYSTILMPTTYFVASFWFVVWWTLRPRPGHPALRAFFWLGLFMGFEAMMVANILFLAGFVLAALFFKASWTDALPASHAKRWRVRAAAAVVLFAGIFLGASPCWLHNYLIAKEPVMLSAHSGINFYIGNNPEATGYPKVPAGMRSDQDGLLKDSITFAEKQTGHPLRHYEVSAFWSDKAHRYIAEHPWDFARLLIVKLGNFWSSYQYDDLGVITPMREDDVLLPGIGFGVIALLGLPGLVLAAVRRPRARWIVAAVLIHMGSLLTVFVTERYRLAAVPGLLLLSAFGLVECATLLASRRWVTSLAYAVLLGGAFLYVNRPPADSGLLYLDDYNTGVADLENNHLERARAKLERVYQHNPQNAESAFAVGNLEFASKNYNKAGYYYQKTIQLDPRHSRAMNNLGVLAMQEQQWEAAAVLFKRALAINPEDARTCYRMAKVNFQMHHLQVARTFIEAALQIDPHKEDYQKLRADVEHEAAIAPL